jgi:transposase
MLIPVCILDKSEQICIMVGMHIHVIPNRNSKPAILLRESYREEGKVKKRTLANLSHFPLDQVETLRRALKGEKLAPADSLFEIIGSKLHGHVDAVRLAMKRLELEQVLSSTSSRQRDLVVAMVAARIVEPDSKLATTRWWDNTTLPEDLGVDDADEDELYAAMDWVLDRQEKIEKKLARRHLSEDGLVLYDLSSSYVEGESCPLAMVGHNRDGKKGKLQVNYGLLTDERGCPVSVSVFPGNTADASTLAAQAQKAREEFGIARFVLVGDRGMISSKQIEQLKQLGEVDWLSALRSGQIRKLLPGGTIDMSLFDERDLCEVTHPDFPGERLVVCRNPLMAQRREHARESLIEATVDELERVRGMVARGRLKGKETIGVRVGRVVNKYKMAKHIHLDIEDDAFEYRVVVESVTAERALDGLYVIRTNLAEERLSTEDAVRRYKDLAQVERAFRSLKSIDLKIRPIYHHLERRVRSHIFLCMLAYYVEWHMKEAWREVLFSDEEQEHKRDRDPVAAAQRSAKALNKVHSKRLEDGTEAHSFRTLLASLSTIVRNTCRHRTAGREEARFTMMTRANTEQKRALDLLNTISV